MNTSTSASASRSDISLITSSFAFFTSVISLFLLIYVHFQFFSRQARSKAARKTARKADRYGRQKTNPDPNRKVIDFSRNVLVISTTVLSVMNILRSHFTEQLMDMHDIYGFDNDTCSPLAELQSASAMMLEWAWAAYIIQSVVILVSVYVAPKKMHCYPLALVPTCMGIARFAVFLKEKECPSWCLWQALFTMLAYVLIFSAVSFLVVSSVKSTMKSRRRDQDLQQRVMAARKDLSYHKMASNLCQPGIIFHVILLVLLMFIFVPRPMVCVSKHFDVTFSGIYHVVQISHICIMLAPLLLLLNEIILFISKQYPDDLQKFLVHIGLREKQIEIEIEPIEEATEMQNPKVHNDDHADADDLDV